MIIEYCEKCSRRITGAGFKDPANPALKYCVDCGKGNGALVGFALTGSENAGPSSSKTESKPARISSRSVTTLKSSPAKGTAMPASDAPAQSPAQPAQTAQPSQPNQPPPAFSKAGGNMAFYFCESCGRRLNASDLEEGRARNKQMKGVYCANCAQGVNTMSFEAISNEQAEAIRKEYNVQAPPETAGALAAKYSARPKKKQAEPVKKKVTISQWQIVAGVAALVGVVAGLFALQSKPKENVTAAASASDSNSTNTIPVPAVTKEPPAKAPVVVAPENSVLTPSSVEENGSKRLAETQKWFAENSEKKEEYRVQLEAITREFPSSAAAAEARKVLAAMKAAEPAPVSKPAPVDPSIAQAAKVKALEDARAAIQTGGLHKAKKLIAGHAEWPQELRAQAETIAADIAKKEASIAAAKKLKQERGAILAEFDRMMMAGEYKAAREYAKSKAASQSAELKRGEGLAQRMADEPAAILRGAQTLVGKETRLKLLKNVVPSALIKAVSDAEVSYATTYVINNEKKERLNSAKWEDLHPEQKTEFARLGGLVSNATDATLLATYSSLAAKDLEAAGKAAEGGKNDPLGAYLFETIQDRVNQLAYETAMKRAEELLAAKKPRDAVAELQKALEARPEDAKALELIDEAKSTPQTVALDLGGGVTMEFVYIAPGTFVMGGSSTTESRFGAVEVPKHTVTITKGYYLGKYEVTQAQYQAIMGSNPSQNKNPNFPVGNTNWTDELEFCKRVSEKTKRKVRLPTEAEWEFACRAGSTEDLPANLSDYAWTDGAHHPVGQKKPNPWGVYDMLGNVVERVGDFYHRDYYANSPKEDPTGPKGTFGNGNNGTTLLRGQTAGSRLRGGGYAKYPDWGFRAAMTADE